MYPGQANSPTTTTVGALSIDATQVTLLNAGLLPDPPNLLVFGGDTSSAETVLMTAKDGDTITIQRGVQGTLKAWAAGTTVARNFTAADYDALRNNMTAVNETIPTRQLLTLPASLWEGNTATLAVPGVTADMPEASFVVEGAGGVAQKAVEASAGLGDTDIIVGDGTITITATRAIPTVDLLIAVTIYGGA
jgi:hypothetical protein